VVARGATCINTFSTCTARAPASLLFLVKTAYFFQVRYLYVVSTAEVRLRYGWSTAESLLNFFISSVTVLSCLPVLLFLSLTGQYKRTSNNMRFPNVRGRFWSFVVLLALFVLGKTEGGKENGPKGRVWTRNGQGDLEMGFV
jgi:hypothetical protein